LFEFWGAKPASVIVQAFAQLFPAFAELNEHRPLVNHMLAIHTCRSLIANPIARNFLIVQ
jgi:hypothetical protein